MRIRRSAAAAVIGPCLLAVPALVRADQQAQGRAGAWEVEFYGGATLVQRTPRGNTSLPPPGPPLTTSSPTFPSRQVSSWLFGDGATLLNDVNSAFGLQAQVVPLDSAFASPASGRSGAALGIKLRRTLTARTSVELAVETAPNRISLPAALSSSAESTRESFEAAIGALLATGPFSDVLIRSTRTVVDGSRRDVWATAAINIHLRRIGAFEPFVTAGAGVAAGMGEAPAVTVEATYRFTVLGLVPIEETDRVTVRALSATTFTAVAGGGVRRPVSGRWMLRIDGRVYVGPGRQRFVLDAAPATLVSGSPPGFIESFTHPSVQFSNEPSTGRQSSLSGAPLRSFDVFESDGLAARVVLTVGLAARF